MLPELIRLDGLPPTSNHMYEENKGPGRRKRLSDPAKQWKQDVAYAVLAQRVQPPQDWTKVPCQIVVEQRMKGTRKQDTTGGLKLAEDAVMEALTGRTSKQHADGYVEGGAIFREQHCDADSTTIRVCEWRPRIETVGPPPAVDTEPSAEYSEPPAPDCGHG